MLSESLGGIVDIFPEAMIVSSGSGLILNANAAARQLFKMSAPNGAHFADLVSDAPEKIARAFRLWSGSRHFLPVSFQPRGSDQELLVRCDGATIRPAARGSSALLLLRCVPRSEATATKLFVKLSEEIDGLLKHIAEQKSRETERLHNLATAAAVFAHEVANPLNAISMALQLLDMELAEQPGLNDSVRKSIGEASAEIERLSALLRDFRNFARPQFVSLQPTDLNKLIREVVALATLSFRTEGGVVRLDLQELPLMMLDGLKIKQAMLNLCKNAVEAMPHGGTLTVRSYPLGNAVIVEVGDTGSGIPAEIDVFGLFKTTKPNGTGLGLPIVCQIVSAHHGGVSYESKPGLGTTFTMRLPAAAGEYMTGAAMTANLGRNSTAE
jgi:signal transduction histidine kinase